MSQINKVLIANRGAIATRIIRTLDTLGIASVAVYAENDRDSLHVQRATERFSLGDGTAADTYLDMDKLLVIATQAGCQAIHPGYGFLSENPEFVRRCEAADIIFIGPTAEQIDMFGQKHIARELAQAAGVPLPPGSPLLNDRGEAVVEAQRISYPVMLKSTAGGGGIGMQLCTDEAMLLETFDKVKRLGSSYFANDGVFLEKAISEARHIEVQVFGDGAGNAISLGERDCSAQRRNQKVVEECPAPNLDSDLRLRLHSTAEALLASVDYRNAGTVEFILDTQTQEFYFLEVNTRLQVEHGVTEMVFGVDLVEWMVLQAGQVPMELDRRRKQLTPSGHAIQVRVYAEDPYRDFRPCAGLMSHVSFPQGDGIRIDHWIESGMTIPADFDPMLAKIMVHADSRDQALDSLQHTLDQVQLFGSETNVPYLRSLSRDSAVTQGVMTTRYLDSYVYTPSRIDVLRGGTMTTIQDLPGRVGYWPVGIPPSGPFDKLSFQIANRLLGNPDSAAGLEITLQGPSLQFTSQCRLVITGGDIDIRIDGKSVDAWRVHTIEANQVLDMGALKGAGARAYLCVAGGIQCPEYLGSRSTFTLGLFGGHNGAALKAGDVLHLSDEAAVVSDAEQQASIDTLSSNAFVSFVQSEMSHDWSVRVIYGPHGAPDFFTQSDIEEFFSTPWQVHYNSSRTGVRLIGPTPEWARSDGGEAGLHPSNIHDNAYAFGSIDFTGDMPVILGPDGPSLGGFVCPATVIHADLWKLGQLRAGDTVSFTAVSVAEAVALDKTQQDRIAGLCAVAPTHFVASDQWQDFSASGITPRGHDTHSQTTGAQSSPSSHAPSERTASPIIRTREAAAGGVAAVYRLAGDRFLLIEYGEPQLDLVSRFRVHALMQWLDENPLTGIIELTPGIRSLQVHYDSHVVALDALLDHLMRAEAALDATADSAVVPSRIVHLPLSWDDEACHLAVQKYDQSVRKNAPWFPSNLEFIRRINGLDSIEKVKQIVFDASYLVMGLGDVYLGAPVATPVNPAHRLVTTKYNPARTWTAENSVGIGGSYLCVYGMEGPGGYQFVGRTLQMWNRYKQTADFEKPWLLRFFDQIRFHEVSHEELTEIRKDFPHGRYSVKVEHTEFSLSDFQALVSDHQDDITAFREQRERAFDKELAQWKATGQFNVPAVETDTPEVKTDWPDDCVVIESPVSGSLWQNCVIDGESVNKGQTLMVLESMKMEIGVSAPEDLRVKHVLFETGQRVKAGQPLIVLETA